MLLRIYPMANKAIQFSVANGGAIRIMTFVASDIVRSFLDAVRLQMDVMGSPPTMAVDGWEHTGLEI